jgi:hypothetical protein
VFMPDDCVAKKAAEGISERGIEMAKKLFPLSGVYGLLEPGPVVMVTTAGRERPNIMTMS